VQHSARVDVVENIPAWIMVWEGPGKWVKNLELRKNGVRRICYSSTKAPVQIPLGKQDRVRMVSYTGALKYRREWKTETGRGAQDIHLWECTSQQKFSATENRPMVLRIGRKSGTGPRVYEVGVPSVMSLPITEKVAEGKKRKRYVMGGNRHRWDSIKASAAGK